MLRARKLGVLTPCVLCVEHEASTIYFERVDGMSVKQALSSSALQPAGADSPCNLPVCTHCKPSVWSWHTFLYNSERVGRVCVQAKVYLVCMALQLNWSCCEPLVAQ